MAFEGLHPHVARRDSHRGHQWRAGGGCTWAVHEWIDGDTSVEGRVACPEGWRGTWRSPSRRCARSAWTAARPRTGACRCTRSTGPPERSRLCDGCRPCRRDRCCLGGSTRGSGLILAPAPCWVHSDLTPSNQPVTWDRLTGVLDFATTGSVTRPIRSSRPNARHVVTEVLAAKPLGSPMSSVSDLAPRRPARWPRDRVRAVDYPSPRGPAEDGHR